MAVAGRGDVDREVRVAGWGVGEVARADRDAGVGEVADLLTPNWGVGSCGVEQMTSLISSSDGFTSRIADGCRSWDSGWCCSEPMLQSNQHVGVLSHVFNGCCLLTLNSRRLVAGGG